MRRTRRTIEDGTVACPLCGRRVVTDASGRCALGHRVGVVTAATTEPAAVPELVAVGAGADAAHAHAGDVDHGGGSAAGRELPAWQTPDADAALDGIPAADEALTAPIPVVGGTAPVGDDPLAMFDDLGGWDPTPVAASGGSAGPPPQAEDATAPVPAGIPSDALPENDATQRLDVFDALDGLDGLDGPDATGPLGSASPEAAPPVTDAEHPLDAFALLADLDAAPAELAATDLGDLDLATIAGRDDHDPATITDLGDRDPTALADLHDLDVASDGLDDHGDHAPTADFDDITADLEGADLEGADLEPLADLDPVAPAPPGGGADDEPPTAAGPPAAPSAATIVVPPLAAVPTPANHPDDDEELRTAAALAGVDVSDPLAAYVLTAVRQDAAMSALDVGVLPMAPAPAPAPHDAWTADADDDPVRASRWRVWAAGGTGLAVGSALVIGAVVLAPL